jgi:hypothetical protein
MESFKVQYEVSKSEKSKMAAIHRKWNRKT